jgi:hypothetical protein
MSVRARGVWRRARFWRANKSARPAEGRRCEPKPGYPAELLDIDLGLDTVGEAEVFASTRDAYIVERDDAFKLGDYPTPARWRCLRTLTA